MLIKIIASHPRNGRKGASLDHSYQLTYTCLWIFPRLSQHHSKLQIVKENKCSKRTRTSCEWLVVYTTPPPPLPFSLPVFQLKYEYKLQGKSILRKANIGWFLGNISHFFLCLFTEFPFSVCCFQYVRCGDEAPKQELAFKQGRNFTLFLGEREQSYKETKGG